MNEPFNAAVSPPSRLRPIDLKPYQLQVGEPEQIIRSGISYTPHAIKYGANLPNLTIEGDPKDSRIAGYHWLWDGFVIQFIAGSEKRHDCGVTWPKAINITTEGDPIVAVNGKLNIN